MAEEVDESLPFKAPEIIAVENATLADSDAAETQNLSDTVSALTEGYTVFGWLSILVAGVLILIAIMMDTSVSTDVQVIGGSLVGGDKVQNIGLLQRQMMLFQGALILFLAGVLLNCTGAVLKVRR